MISERARKGLIKRCSQPLAGSMTSSQHVYEYARARIAAEMSPNEPFFELYRRKTLVAARRSLAIVSALVG